MPCAFSTSVEPSRLADLAYALITQHNADLLLSGAEANSINGETACIAGIAPVRECTIHADTTRKQIAEFCFGNGDCPKSVAADQTKPTSSTVSPPSGQQNVHQRQTVGPVMGFISYTYGMAQYGIHSDKPQSLPQGLLRRYSIVLRFNTQDGTIQCHAAPDANEKLIRTLEQLCTQPPEQPVFDPPMSIGNLWQSMSREQYVSGVENVLKHIRRGDTYVLNLSIKFGLVLPELDAPAALAHFWQRYPASFYAWFRYGQKQILSTSPERFLKVENGKVLTQPIKGTVVFDEYEQGMERLLTESPKESAELSMIVDLMRNDISHHCEYGSVHVYRHKHTFIVDNLIQMYSDVSGTLRHDRTCLDLFLDAFPGGSVTGCPKKRTLEIIEKLEPHSRDLYCGSMVCIEDERNMDSSIAIRTGWYDTADHSFRFYAGSGLVVDSVPEREYAETLAKAGKFVRVLAG